MKFKLTNLSLSVLVATLAVSGCQVDLAPQAFTEPYTDSAQVTDSEDSSKEQDNQSTDQAQGGNGSELGSETSSDTSTDTDTDTDTDTGSEVDSDNSSETSTENGTNTDGSNNDVLGDVLLSPQLGENLSGSVAFTTSVSGNVWLYFGSALGQKDLGEIQMTSTSRDFDFNAIESQSINVRVWVYLGDTWHFKDYLFNLDNEDEHDHEVPDMVDNGTDSVEVIEEHNAWTWVTADPTIDYGTKTLTVRAARNWVNSGVYLTAGQSANISATGQWTVSGQNTYGPDGDPNNTARGCQEGELIARVGLFYKDSRQTCVGSEGTITAQVDGILFLGASVANDLGETYEARRFSSGQLEVTVTAENAASVPIIAAEDSATFDYNQVRSGQVEIRNQNIIVTLPLDTAKQDAARLPAMMARLSDYYDTQAELRGIKPYFGQPVRFFADTEDAPGWMLAGNPVRMDPALVDKNSPDRITLVTNQGNNGWGFAHELGHNFNFAGGNWYYTTFGGLESWPNVFTLYSIERLGLPGREDQQDCATQKAKYLATGKTNGDFGDAWLGLCFLMEFQQNYGWDFYKNFYADFNQSPGHGWNFLYTKFNAAAGEDTRWLFQSWNIAI